MLKIGQYLIKLYPEYSRLLHTEVLHDLLMLTVSQSYHYLSLATTLAWFFLTFSTTKNIQFLSLE